MRKVLTGQSLLILCCFFYLIWWYRGYRPGIPSERVSGINGILLFFTVALGVAGFIFSSARIPGINEPKIYPTAIVIIGIISYFVLLLITRFAFQRIVTTELFLIIGWTALEMSVINRLNVAGILSGKSFGVMCIVIATAFLISMVLYVAYYRMEEMKAFHAAMVPLITEAASMVILIWMMLTGNR